MSKRSKIYLVFIHGINLNRDKYPGIPLISDINVSPNGEGLAFYGWTRLKKVKNDFKRSRDMKKFYIAEKECDDENEISEFTEKYSDLLLEYRPYSTKAHRNGRIISATVLILSTAVERDYIFFSTNFNTYIEENASYLFDNETIALIDSNWFKNKYAKVLEKFNFNEVFCTLFPDELIDEIEIDKDSMALYCHFFKNTYRKDLSLCNYTSSLKEIV
jgi:hypothetical protein